MAEENDADQVEETPASPPSEAPSPEPTPSEPVTSGSNLRVIGIAVAASLATAIVTYGATSLVTSAGERRRMEAAQVTFDEQLGAANQRTADVQGQLETLHQKQALYVAHTSVVRAMQELDKNNYGSASELMKHAGDALGAADPAVAGPIRQAIVETQIEVGADRIAQLNQLREIAKGLQEALGS